MKPAGYLVGYIDRVTSNEGTLVTHNDGQIDYEQAEAETRLSGAWLSESLQGLDNPRAFRLYALVELPVAPVCGACAGTGINDIGKDIWDSRMRPFQKLNDILTGVFPGPQGQAA